MTQSDIDPRARRGRRRRRLADAAFACACNSYNRVSLAQAAHITFARPARVGDVLTAAAEPVSAGPTGV